MVESDHHNYTPYAYAYNNPVLYIDVMGLDTNIYVFDTGTQPTDDYQTAQYTGLIYVDADGYIHGPYRGSSYPDSKENDSETEYNTVSEDDHDYNNESGHSGGTKKGLNIDDSENGSRTTTGTDPDGNQIDDMENVNVHKGYNTRRFSEGCITVHPDDWDSFSKHFDWSNGGTKGNSTGTLKIYRGNRTNSLEKLNEVTNKLKKQNKVVNQLIIKSGL